MISTKLRKFFLISIVLFIIHGLEEYFTGFYDVDPIFKYFFGPFERMSNLQALFLLFQIMLWLLLIISLLLIASKKWQLSLMIIPGLVYIFELHHIYKAVTVGGYYPGLITALAFPFIAFYFWKELIHNWSAGFPPSREWKTRE